MVAGIGAIRARLPFPLLGIDSDNGGEFINAHLKRYCDAGGITFTRCRGPALDLAQQRPQVADYRPEYAAPSRPRTRR